MNGLHYLNPQLPDYELIDCGNFAKLERFGDHIVRRPEPQALWQPSLPDEEWTRLADATFRRDAKSDERGSWQRRSEMPERWTMEHRLGASSVSGDGSRGVSEGVNLRLRLALTGFKHVGVFPEQAENWEFIYDLVREKATLSPRAPCVLNLFAYTGGATLAARAAGAEVTHVDAVKQTVSWARDNLILSELSENGVHWIVDDAMKFVRRQVRRGSLYDGIVLDPPAYGRGPEGEKWVLEQGLDEMLAACAQLLDGHGFMVLNLYSMGVSAMVARTALHTHFGTPAEEQFGELFVTDRAGKNLPLGVYHRFTRG